MLVLSTVKKKKILVMILTEQYVTIIEFSTRKLYSHEYDDSQP